MLSQKRVSATEWRSDTNPAA